MSGRFIVSMLITLGIVITGYWALGIEMHVKGGEFRWDEFLVAIIVLVVVDQSLKRLGFKSEDDEQDGQ